MSLPGLRKNASLVRLWGFLLVFFLCCGEDRLDRESVLMAVSDDPQFIKTLSSLGELHFEILYYLVYITHLCV